MAMGRPKAAGASAPTPRWQNHPARSFESSASTTFALIVSIGAHCAVSHAANLNGRA